MSEQMDSSASSSIHSSRITSPNPIRSVHPLRPPTHRSTLVNLLLDIPKSKRPRHIQAIQQTFKVDLSSDPLLQEKPPRHPKSTNILQEIQDSLCVRSSIESIIFTPYVRQTTLATIEQLIQEVTLLNSQLQRTHESSLYFAYQIGFYLHLFKHHKETFPQMKYHFHYKKAWCYFLIQLFNLLEEYPMLQHSNKSPSFFHRNLVHIRHELFLLSETDKRFWRNQQTSS